MRNKTEHHVLNEDRTKILPRFDLSIDWIISCRERLIESGGNLFNYSQNVTAATIQETVDIQDPSIPRKRINLQVDYNNTNNTSLVLLQRSKLNRDYRKRVKVRSLKTRSPQIKLYNEVGKCFLLLL